MKKNYQRELEQLLEGLTSQITEMKDRNRLLLHSCCAPCSSYVLEYLSEYFQITVFYYNPNIYPDKEYEYRVEEQRGFIRKFKTKYPVTLETGAYEPERFYEIARGFENEKEGKERCFRCYELRMREAARLAKKGNYDFFTTTLSISPLKNADKLNEIGKKLEQEFEVRYLTSDFKKRDGYKRSVELSKQYGLYRQDYCGCVFSKKNQEKSYEE